MERPLYGYIAGICCKAGRGLLAIMALGNHVHLLVRWPSTIALGQLNNEVRRGSSPYMSEKLVPGQWFAWGYHFGCTSISAGDTLCAIEHIRNKKQGRAYNTTWAAFERANEKGDGDDPR